MSPYSFLKVTFGSAPRGEQLARRGSALPKTLKQTYSSGAQSSGPPGALASPSQARAERRAAPTRSSATSGCSASNASARARRPEVAARTNSSTMPDMRAIVIEEKGGPDVLQLRDEPEPTPGDDELLVQVEAVGVNYRDVYEREGRGAAYGNAKVPLIVGAEGAGTVLRGAGEFAEGDRVGWVAAPGVLRGAGRGAAAGPRSRCPTGVSSEQAAAVLLQGMTAHYLAYSTYPVQAGDDGRRARGGGRRRAAAHADGQAARRARDRDDVHGGEGATLARAAGADDALGYDGFRRRVLWSWAAPTSSTTRSARRRSRTASPSLRARGLSRPLRHGVRAGAGLRPAAAAGEVAVPHPARAPAVHRHARGAARAGGRGARARSRTGRSTCGSAARYPFDDARRCPRGPRSAPEHRKTAA